MKSIFSLLIVLLFGANCVIAQSANTKQQNRLTQYVSKKTKPYYDEQLRWFKPEPRFSISKFKFKSVKGKKLLASKKRSTPQSLSPYIAYKSNPYYSTHQYWRFNEQGILQDTFKTAERKRKLYGKELFTTLKRLYNEGKEKEAFSKALSVLSQSSLSVDSQQEVELLTFIAAFCDKNSLWNEAENFYRSALTVRLLEPEFFSYGEISLNLASVLNKQRKYDESLKFIHFALTEYSNAGNLNGIATSNLLIADNYYNRGDLLVAEKVLLTKALSLFSFVGNQEGRMACFEKLGHIYTKLNRNSEAKWFFIQQNMLADKQSNKREQFNSLVDLGKVKVAIGDYKLALKDFREANTLLSTVNSIESELKLEEAYGQLFKKQGNKKLMKLSHQRCKKLKGSLSKNEIAQKKAASKILNLSKEQKQIYIAKAEINDL